MKRIRKNISLALLVLILATLSTVKIARANNSTHAAPAKLSVGLWGGTDLEMQVSSQGSTLEFDCAQGTISEPSSSMNPENSKRRALSKHTLAPPKETSRPARTRLIPVHVDGDTMHITFTVGDNKDAAANRFTLVRGNPEN